jgi:hypothetical protein
MSAGQLGKRLLEEVEEGSLDEVRYRFLFSAPLDAKSPPLPISSSSDISVCSFFPKSENQPSGLNTYS